MLHAQLWERKFIAPLISGFSSRVGKTTVAKAFVTGQLVTNARPSVATDLLFKILMLGQHKAYVQVISHVCEHSIIISPSRTQLQYR